MNLNRSDSDRSSSSCGAESKRSFYLNKMCDEEIEKCLAKDRFLQLNDHGWIEPSTNYVPMPENRLGKQDGKKVNEKMNINLHLNNRSMDKTYDNGEFSFWKMHANISDAIKLSVNRKFSCLNRRS